MDAVDVAAAHEAAAVGVTVITAEGMDLSIMRQATFHPSLSSRRRRRPRICTLTLLRLLLPLDICSDLAAHPAVPSRSNIATRIGTTRRATRANRPTRPTMRANTAVADPLAIVVTTRADTEVRKRVVLATLPLLTELFGRHQDLSMRTCLLLLLPSLPSTPRLPHTSPSQLINSETEVISLRFPVLSLELVSKFSLPSLAVDSTSCNTLGPVLWFTFLLSVRARRRAEVIANERTYMRRY